MKEIFYDWGGANLWLFHAINNVRGGFIDGFMRLGTLLGEHTHFPVYLALIALTATALVSRAFARDPRAAPQEALRWLGVITVFGVAYVLDGALVHWLKIALDFPRPPAIVPPASLHVLGQPEYRFSLPSGHAAFALTVAASLWPALNRYWRIGLAGFVLWIGLSRISLGVHFPADVVVGFLIGLIVVLLVRLALTGMMRALAKR